MSIGEELPSRPYRFNPDTMRAIMEVPLGFAVYLCENKPDDPTAVEAVKFGFAQTDEAAEAWLDGIDPDSIRSLIKTETDV